MSLCDLSKTLSSELENLFAQLGDSNLPEEAHRLSSQQQGTEAMDAGVIIERMRPANTEAS